MKLKVTVAQDDAYHAVWAEGAAAMATKVEQVIYSAGSPEELVGDLHSLIKSARAAAE